MHKWFYTRKLFGQGEPLSMSLQGLSYHWQAVFFILWIIQGHKIYYAFCFAYSIFLLLQQMEPLSMSLQDLSYHWRAVFFILWIIQGHKICYAFCVAYSMFHIYQQMEPLSMSLQDLSYHWQAVIFSFWIMQGHKIFCAFCFAYVPFILANGTSFNVSPRPELPLTSTVFYFVDHPRTRYFMLLFCLCSFLLRQMELLSMSF